MEVELRFKKISLKLIHMVALPVLRVYHCLLECCSGIQLFQVLRCSCSVANAASSFPIFSFREHSRELERVCNLPIPEADKEGIRFDEFLPTQQSELQDKHSKYENQESMSSS